MTELLEAWETYLTFDIFHSNLILQNVVNLVDAFGNVERWNVFDEVFTAIFENSVIEHVKDEMIDKLNTIRHLGNIDIYPGMNQLQFGLNLNDELILIEVGNIEGLD